MFGRIINIVISFLLACLAAGLTKVLFATTPSELAGLPPDVAADKMAKVVDWTLSSGAINAIFAAPFALVAAAIGEWRRLHNWIYYALTGVAISLIGFLSHYSNENPGAPTIVNNYALTAFLTAGFVGGLVYWLFAGRSAGGPVTTKTEGMKSGGMKPAGMKTGSMTSDNAKPSKPVEVPKPAANADKPKPASSVPSSGNQPKKA